MLMLEKRIKASLCAHGCVDSALFCIHTVFDAVANSPEQQNGHIAKMNINHRNLTLLYLYTKYSKLNKIILIMKL